MRSLLAFLFLFVAASLPGQCISVQIDSVFCLANGEYGILYDVEGTGDGGWVLEGYNVSGGYFTDEILELQGLLASETNLVFRDSLDPDCLIEVTVMRPDECGTTDPCFGFEMRVSSVPGTCNQAVRVSVFPFASADTIFVLNQNDEVVDFGFIPDFPDFVDFTDLPPGTYSVSTSFNVACTVSQDFTVTDGNGCGSISGSTWVDENNDGIRNGQDVPLPDVRVELFAAADLSNSIAVQIVTPNGYIFNELPEGEYVIRFRSREVREATLYQVGDDPALDNDMLQNYLTAPLTVAVDGAVMNIDAGFQTIPCAVAFVTGNDRCQAGNGRISADVVGQPPFDYLWSTGQTTPDISGLSSDTYSLTVTDAVGCQAVGFAEIGETPAVFAEVSEENNGCGADPTLVATASGGIPPYTYTWRNENGEIVCQQPECQGYGSGEIYRLTVEDAVFCFANVIDTIQGNSTINFFAPFYLPCDGGSVTIGVDNSTDYDYTWVSPSGVTLTGHTIEATEVGDYRVTGTSTGSTCTLNGTATVLPALRITGLSLEVVDSSDCGFGNCVFPAFSDPDFPIFAAEYFWYGPDGTEYQTNSPFFCTEETGLFVFVARVPCDTVILSIELNTGVECADINGTVYVDNAADCSFDAGDLPAEGILVHIQSTDGTRNYYAVTDENGQYGQEVETGDYTVTPVTDGTRPFGQCDPPTAVTVVAGQPNQADAYLPVLLSCPLLTVDVSMPFLRRCFLSCAYVEYENEGSAVAENTQLTVTLDPLFIGVDPSIVPAMIDGNTYTFDLGDLPPFASGRIFFNFTVSCDAELGQSHCLEANITPNDVCNEPDDWNGALVSVDPGSCNGEEVSFRIANVGDNAMSVPLSYVVVEDGIMMTPEPVIVEELAPDEVFTLILPADGQTYQVITNQEPNAPASDAPTAMLEGCLGNSVNGGSTGFANILSLGNGFPSEAIVCRENVGAYDPNDKNGYPLGYGAENNIAPGTELRYAIRFQNTGTDTAFNIVIRDTISPALDLSSFKAGSSSHDYTVNIDSQRVVTFTFANIMLPDSNVNLLASQGVVNFTIDHDPGLVPGDPITNEAAIYFDFNEPIITNLSHHRIEVEGLPVGVRSLRAREISLRVFPNPSSGLIQVDVPNDDVKYTDVLTVNDLYGRQVAKTTYGRIGSGWDVRGLPAGYYLVVVHDAAGRARGRAGFVVK